MNKQSASLGELLAEVKANPLDELVPNVRSFRELSMLMALCTELAKGLDGTEPEPHAGSAREPSPRMGVFLPTFFQIARALFERLCRLSAIYT